MQVHTQACDEAGVRHLSNSDVINAMPYTPAVSAMLRDLLALWNTVHARTDTSLPSENDPLLQAPTEQAPTGAGERVRPPPPPPLFPPFGNLFTSALPAVAPLRRRPPPLRDALCAWGPLRTRPVSTLAGWPVSTCHCRALGLSSATNSAVPRQHCLRRSHSHCWVVSASPGRCSM